MGIRKFNGQILHFQLLINLGFRHRQGHKLNIELIKNSSAKFSFFTNRATKLWNTLKIEDATAISFNSFKSVLLSKYDY